MDENIFIDNGAISSEGEGEVMEQKMDMPEIKKRQWVTIGHDLSSVVSNVYSDQTFGVAEVVYLNDGKAINDDIVWAGDKWEFAVEGASGGYADKYSRLAPYVAQLRSGRK